MLKVFKYLLIIINKIHLEVLVFYLKNKMRAIINRFDNNDELILLVDDVRKKLHTSATAIVKTALWQYCNQILNKNGRTKN